MLNIARKGRALITQCNGKTPHPVQDSCTFTNIKIQKAKNVFPMCLVPDIKTWYVNYKYDMSMDRIWYVQIKGHTIFHKYGMSNFCGNSKKKFVPKDPAAKITKKKKKKRNSIF